MEQLNCGKKQTEKLFWSSKQCFHFASSLLLLLLLLGFYYFNFSFFVFNFFRTHMLSQDVSKWLSMSKYGVGVSMRIFLCVKTLSFHFRNPCSHLYFWTIFNVLKHARGCLKRAVVVYSEYFIQDKVTKKSLFKSFNQLSESLFELLFFSHPSWWQ